MREFYQTERLFLLPASPLCAKALTDYYYRNRDFLKEFEPERDEHFFKEETQRKILTEEQKRICDKTAFRFYLSPEQPTESVPQIIIGTVALNNIVWGCFESCFLGYKLDKDYLRQGLMTEAVNECVRIAFEELGLHRIEANIMPKNKASLGVVQKCGFREEGISPKYLKINGVWEDHIHMVKLNEASEGNDDFCREKRV